MPLVRETIKTAVKAAVEDHLLTEFDLPPDEQYDDARATYATVAQAVAEGVDEAIAAIIETADVTGVQEGSDTVAGAIE